MGVGGFIRDRGEGSRTTSRYTCTQGPGSVSPEFSSQAEEIHSCPRKDPSENTDFINTALQVYPGLRTMPHWEAKAQNIWQAQKPLQGYLQGQNKFTNRHRPTFTTSPNQCQLQGLEVLSRIWQKPLHPTKDSRNLLDSGTALGKMVLGVSA